MNFYEHTIIARQDISQSQIKSKKIKKEIIYILKLKVKVIR